TQNIDARMAQSLGLSNPHGALVTRILPNSAGAAAGLQPGDVILAANDQRVDNAETLHNYEGLQPVGSSVTLEVHRGGKPLKIRLTLKELPRAIAGETLDSRLSGAIFVDLPESLRQSGVGGVMVNKVKHGSRAAANGLVAGDVIIAASIGGFSDLASWRASFSHPPQRLILRVLRDNTQYDALMR
ncbi:MAG TPA: PDZ domain-containing protein, partial [Xylella fastidiosa subsp. pauca]